MTRIQNKPFVRQCSVPRRVVLEARASAMRAFPTSSEQRLWAGLRGGRLGAGFRRQVPILGRFIVDFYAPAARLIVEIDGGYHVERVRRDLHRDRVLGRAGYRVLRLQSVLVECDMQAVLAAIRVALRR